MPKFLTSVLPNLSAVPRPALTRHVLGSDAHHAAPLPCLAKHWVVAQLKAGLAVLAVLASTTAQANDRPYQIARTAVMEDDERVWSFESWIERRGSLRGLSVEPEYTFGGGYSVQFQLSRFLDRTGDQTGHEAEVELKHIFNHIARDGYGMAVSAALGAERTAEGGSVRTLSLKLPISIALGEGLPTLHLNPGLSRARAAGWTWTRAVAIEHEVYKRTTVFAELAQEGSLRFAQVGVRHWLRRDRLAVDLAWQQHRSFEGRAPGLILGPGWYDLGF